MVFITFATQAQAQDGGGPLSGSVFDLTGKADPTVLTILLAITGYLLGLLISDLINNSPRNLPDLVQEFPPATFLDDIPSVVYPVLENLEWVIGLNTPL